MRSPAFGRVLFVSIVFASLAPAQTQFQLISAVGDSIASIQNRSTVTLSAALGQAQTARIRVTYLGTGQVLIPQEPTLIGSAAFTAKLTTGPPVTVRGGESFVIEIQYVPTSAAQSVALLSLTASETLPVAPGSMTPGSTAPATATVIASTIDLSLQGTAPSIVLSYILQADQNVIPLTPGDTFVFPVTPIRSTGQVALNLTNRGSGPGTITAVSISGTTFRLAGLPLFPVILSAGQNLQLLVLYQPVSDNSDNGQITVAFDAGPPVTINLQGRGSLSSFVYQVLQTPPLTVSPGNTVSLPDANVGETSSVVIRVLNSGNASGTVSSITSTGQGFQLSNVPVLPQTLAPDASLTFTVTFAPTRPGVVTGSLIVNSDTLNLRGVGLGPQLTLSYVTGGTSITLGGSTSSVVFSPATISRSAQIAFHVTNTGTLPASIANIGVGQVNSPFSLTGLPALPVSLAPSADLQFTVNFAPTALGFSNGTLQIDTTVVPLVGSGTPPPALPSYTIVGPSGNTTPGSQSAVGLTLASAYPVAISGTLTLSISGDLPADPAVQFATGGRTAAFVIPANSTNAVFGGQGTRLGIQTGTVAGTITLTPSFATQAGQIDLSPTTPTVLQSVIAPAPPVLSFVQLSSPATNSLLLRVTGFSTTRSLKGWNVQFTTVPGVNMPTSKFTLDVQQIAAAWFRSTASQAFGGQFTVAVQFNFQGAASDGQPVLNSVTSVAVTVNNDLGESNSIQSKLQ